MESCTDGGFDTSARKKVIVATWLCPADHGKNVIGGWRTVDSGVGEDRRVRKPPGEGSGAHFAHLIRPDTHISCEVFEVHARSTHDIISRSCAVVDRCSRVSNLTSGNFGVAL